MSNVYDFKWEILEALEEARERTIRNLTETFNTKFGGATVRFVSLENDPHHAQPIFLDKVVTVRFIRLERDLLHSHGNFYNFIVVTEPHGKEIIAFPSKGITIVDGETNE